MSANTRHTGGQAGASQEAVCIDQTSLLLEVSSHTAMGIAVGLAFAFLATHITALGIATVINESPTPDVVMIMFVGTCVITFGIGATMTGLAITLTEDPDTTLHE